MLTTILVLLIVLWLLGMVSSYTLGGFIHILLIIAIAVVLIRVIQGRRPFDRGAERRWTDRLAPRRSRRSPSANLSVRHPCQAHALA